MKIFLDDIREAPDGWLPVRSAMEAMIIISLAIKDGHTIEKISLDHDLGEGLSGYDVACFIEKEVMKNPLFKCPEILIHSANPVGRQRIQQVIDSIDKKMYSSNPDYW